MKSFKVSVNTIDYACVEAGEGPLLLLMHGLFGGKALFMPQIEHLSRSFRCVAFDWPGHGESGFDPAGWTVDDLVRTVPEIIAALGERKAFLCGVSQGGAVALRVAITYPALVSGLIDLCGGPGGPAPEAAAALDNFAATLANETDEGLRRNAVQQFVKQIFHDPGFAARAPERADAEIRLILDHPRESVRLLPAVPKSYRLLTQEQLAAIRCPTCIIWAEHDGRPQLGAELTSAIPGAELVMIEAAGHHVNVDQPETTSRAIEAFLKRHI